LTIAVDVEPSYHALEQAFQMGQEAYSRREG
jgi:hypothetical protein